MINNVVLVGRLTKDIELRRTESNLSVCQFNLACNRMKTQNNPEPGADFIQCVAWRGSADFLSKYAHKGDMIGVVGRISTRTYDGQNGKVYVTEVTCDHVQLLSSPKKEQQPQVSQQSSSYTFNELTRSAELEDNQMSFNDVMIDTDDLPFY